jgi:hypothetical protein
MKTVREIAEENNLEYTETTSERNGYPSNIQGAIIGFDTFEQAEKIAKEENLSIMVLQKKEGQALWYRTGGTPLEAMSVSSDDYGDDYSTISCCTEEEFMSSEVNPFLEDGFESIDELQTFLSLKREVWQEVSVIDEDEAVVTHHGRYVETISKNTMYWSHDTKHWVIGLI